jgi:hypothetical protein
MGDGLFVFDRIAADQLPSILIGFNSTLHSDFLTDGDQQNVDFAMSKIFNSELLESHMPRELVSRNKNRLVLVNSNRVTFLAATAGDEKSISGVSGKSFEQKYMFAFVVVLTTKPISNGNP